MMPIKPKSEESLRPVIEEAHNRCLNQSPDQLPPEFKQAVEETVGLINRGHLRVTAMTSPGIWTTNAWVKQAILLFFRLHGVSESHAGPLHWVDKIPLKEWNVDMGVRVVPPAVARYGSFIAQGCVLMPCYINIGAYVDSGSMIDTWATVGSCAQVGKNVHLSGGVGLGGVLEPAQARPVIIEDECFIGSRAIVVEGVWVKRRAVLGAGVVLTASTPIVDVRGAKPEVSKGLIPENAVVIPGTIPKTFSAGVFQVPCALIIGERNASTDSKTSLNQALREFDVPV